MSAGRARLLPVAVGVVSVLSVLLLALSGCTVSSPDRDEWRDLAQQALSDVAGEVATARLTLVQLDRDRLPAAYGETVLAEAEKAAATAEDSLASVQPPAGLGEQPDQVLALLGRGTDAVRKAREVVVDGRSRAPALVRAMDRLLTLLDERRSRL